MRAIYHKSFFEHDTGNHPENSDRLKYFKDKHEVELDFDRSPILQVHTEQHVKNVEVHSQRQEPMDADTVCSEFTYKAAVYAANCAIKAAETGDFAFVRPPGHHAYAKKAAGFCLFNNIAVASQYLVNQGKKVLIIDFDGHFGDGTSSIFYNRKDVLFCSLHQYPAYPGKGATAEIGEGEGLGYNINIELPPQAGDDILLDGIKSLMPVFKQFKPDVVALSAGFDGHITDPLLQLRFSTAVYHEIGKIFRKEFDNIFAVLEGGYQPDILAECVTNFILGINGKKRKYNDRHTDSDLLVWDQYILNHDQLISKLKNIWTFS